MVEIKKATLDDFSSIQALNKKLFLYEIKQGYDDNINPDWNFSKEGINEIKERITSKESCGIVIKIDNKVVGYLIGLILEDETGRKESRYAELEHMFVDKEHRGKGLGEKLVVEFKKWAKNKNLKRLKANISYKNKKAIAFYKKSGLISADITMAMNI